MSVNFCGKEKCINYHPIPPELDEYFGVYKPNNWWVYTNATRTKRDSVFIKNYKLYDNPNVYIAGGGTECGESRYFDLINTFLSTSEIKAGYIRYIKYDENFILFSTAKGSFQNNSIGFFYFDKQSHEIKSSCCESSYIDADLQKTLNENRKDSILLNDTWYKDVLIGSNDNISFYYYQKGIGLVGWQTPTDTFNLIKIKIN